MPSWTTSEPVVPTGVSPESLRAATRSPLPLPGGGSTWQRWQRFVEEGRTDLAMAKCVEPHYDAHAILTDLGSAWDPAAVWAVWAAEPPFAITHAHEDEDGWVLQGAKAFCSGAELVTRALITADDGGRSRLFAIDLDQPGIQVDRKTGAWVGLGMAGAQTHTITLTDARATAVGTPGAYTDRPGFWHGAMGVAACWLGGAQGVAAPLEHAATLDDHGLAHRGAVRVALHQAEAVLRCAAASIDHDPESAGEWLAQAVRGAVVDAVETVVRHVGRALGPGPLAFDAEHSRRVADLHVFVRQHHAERDLARLGSLERS